MFTGKKFNKVEDSKRPSIFQLTKENNVHTNFVQTVSKLRLNGNLQKSTSYFGTKTLPRARNLMDKSITYDYLTSRQCENPGDDIQNGMLALKEFDTSVDFYGGNIDNNLWVQLEIIEAKPMIDSIICFDAKPKQLKKFRMNKNGQLTSLIPTSRYLNIRRIELLEKNFWAFQTNNGPVIGFNKEVNGYDVWDIINKYWTI